MSSLTNPSQLILRNQTYFDLEHLVVVGLPADDLAHRLLEGGTGRVTALTKDFNAYQYLLPRAREDRFSLSFGPILSTPFAHDVDGVLIFLQKSKALTDFWLDMVMSFLPAGAPVWLVGENDEGIKSWKKRLKHNFTAVRSVDNARHCGLLEACEPVANSAGFSLESRFENFAVSAGAVKMNIASLPGVFSHGRLDQGTRLLLESLNSPPSGKVLDFGCGAGVISAYMHHLPGRRHYTLLDCDALALASSQKTMENNGCQSFKVVASDGLAAVSGHFDLIISNPPFHKGVKTHYEVTERFLVESRQLLSPGGELRIVANSFLRYSPIILQTFGCCETALSKDGFTVYRAS